MGPCKEIEMLENILGFCVDIDEHEIQISTTLTVNFVDIRDKDLEAMVTMTRPEWCIENSTTGFGCV